MKKTILFLLFIGFLPIVIAANNTVFIDGYLVTSTARSYDYNLSIYNSTGYVGLFNVSSVSTSGSIPSTNSLTSYNITLNGSILTSNLAIDSFGDSHVQVYRYAITYANGSTMLTENSPSISGSYSTAYVFTSTNISHDIPIQKIELQRVSSSGGTPLVCNYGGCTYSYETPGYINASLPNGTYNIIANDTRYALTSENHTLGTVSGFDNFTFQLYSTNTILFRIYDETNQTLINTTTVYLTLSGSVLGYNYSTTTGTKTASLLIADNYLITYYANGYYQRLYNYYVNNSTSNTLNLYLLPQISNTTLFQANVIDLFDFTAIPNATVYLEKKNLTGSNYYQVEQCITASDGKCLMSLQLYTVIYKFLVSYGGVQRLDSGDEILADVTQTFQISTTTDELENLVARNNISTVMSNTSNSIAVTWVESGSQISQACLTVYGRYKTSYTTQNRSCSTGSSGTINITGITTTGVDEVIGVASYNISGNEQNYASLSIFNSANTRIGSVGFIMIGLGIPLTAALAFLFHPVAAIPVFGLGIYLGWAGGYISLTQGAVALILCLGAILFLRMRT